MVGGGDFIVSINRVGIGQKGKSREEKEKGVVGKVKRGGGPGGVKMFGGPNGNTKDQKEKSKHSTCWWNKCRWGLFYVGRHTGLGGGGGLFVKGFLGGLQKPPKGVGTWGVGDGQLCQGAKKPG